MKKFFVFVMALCCSAVMFAGGDIFEAWVTYSVNDDAMGFSRQEYWSGVPLSSPYHMLVSSKSSKLSFNST